MAQACEALGVPVVSGNVSLYNETDGRGDLPRRRSSAASASSRTCARSPARGARATRCSSRARAELRLDGSEYQARFLGGPAGRPPLPDLHAETALVRVPLAAAPRPHERARRRRGRARGRARRAALCRRDRCRGGARLAMPSHWFGEGGGRAVVACARGRRRASSGARRAAPEHRTRRRRLGCSASASPTRGPPTRLSPRPRLMCGDPRHPRARARRRAARVLRALRPPAPRPGVGRDRGLGRQAADGPPRHGPRHAGLLRGQAARPRGRGGDRALPLLDDGLDELGERPADRPARRRRGPSRSATTATSRTRPSCARSCVARRPARARPPTPR